MKLKLSLSVLISTIDDRIMNIQSSQLLEHPNVEYCIVHQVANPQIEDNSINERINELRERKNIHYKAVENKGLSKSRNIALGMAKHSICLFSDDDVIYKNDFYQKIFNAFEQNPKADIYTFKIDTPDKQSFRKYWKSDRKHHHFSLGGVCSIEISAKKNSLIENNIEFNEYFGLGTKFPACEEFIFLNDCSQKGLNCRFYPETIAIHPKESTGDQSSSLMLQTRGAVFYHVYGWMYPLAAITFAILKSNQYKNIFSSIQKILSGATYYKTICRQIT